MRFFSSSLKIILRESQNWCQQVMKLVIHNPFSEISQMKKLLNGRNSLVVIKAIVEVEELAQLLLKPKKIKRVEKGEKKVIKVKRVIKVKKAKKVIKVKKVKRASRLPQTV